MNKRRLLKLADLLEKDARRKKGIKFDMDRWGLVKSDKKPILSCNTQACALGLAALSGAFKRAGLGYELVPWLDEFQIHITENGEEGDEYGIAANIFGIEYGISRELFYPDAEGNEKGAQVERAKAKQIRNFVKTGELMPLSEFL